MVFGFFQSRSEPTPWWFGEAPEHFTAPYQPYYLAHFALEWREWSEQGGDQMAVLNAVAWFRDTFGVPGVGFSTSEKDEGSIATFNSDSWLLAFNPRVELSNSQLADTVYHELVHSYQFWIAIRYATRKGEADQARAWGIPEHLLLQAAKSPPLTKKEELLGASYWESMLSEHDYQEDPMEKHAWYAGTTVWKFLQK
jgi:hypothetical protein